MGGGDVPALSAAQMREVDRLMVKEYHVELVQMMENAGRHLAHVARTRFLGRSPVGKRVVVLAGSGGNGGGAMVCARRLHGWGAAVTVFLTRAPSLLSGVPAHQADILDRVGVPLVHITGTPLDQPIIDLVIDGLIGYSLAGAPTGRAAELIRWANTQPAPILALDVPSGLDATTGRALRPCVRATATMTLALPKLGLVEPEARGHVGDLYLADIGVPPELYALPSVGIRVGAVFGEDDIVRLW